MLIVIYSIQAWRKHDETPEQQVIQRVIVSPSHMEISMKAGAKYIDNKEDKLDREVQTNK
jgi:hypothetical protein